MAVWCSAAVAPPLVVDGGEGAGDNAVSLDKPAKVDMPSLLMASPPLA
jgi:hypothetical protein